MHENFRAYTICAPDWDAWANCYYGIYDNNIGYLFHRQFNLAGADLAAAFWLTYLNPDGTLNDVETALQDPEVRKANEETRISFQLILAGTCREDIELQDRILDAILADTGCRMKSTEALYQACNDVAQWPFKPVADVAAGMAIGAAIGHTSLLLFS